MRAALDSSYFRPSKQVVAQARVDGVGVWGGYLATKSRVGLASPWDLASFDVVRALPGQPIAYCSGWDDPAACARLAKEWGLKPALDVEGGGLRPDGSWVQGWIDAAGRNSCGLYGNYPVFAGRAAAFYVVGGYPGYDPGRTWGYVARPNGPCGWQWRGSANEYGGSVDRCWFDDWFVAGQAAPEEAPMSVWVIQGDQKPQVWLTDGLVRRYIRTMAELAGWLRRTKTPLEKIPQYEVDRIARTWENPEDLAGTGLTTYDDIIFGPPHLPVPTAPRQLQRSLPADAWAPSEGELADLHQQLGFYPVKGEDHKA